jgi:hypothetical protein
MARLVYSMIESLDGYVAAPAGRFGWAEPDKSMHTFVNELERSVGTYLYGRRMYEVMVAWESLGGFGDQPSMKEEVVDDISIGGPTLAAAAIRAELVDERRFDNGMVYLSYRRAT